MTSSVGEQSPEATGSVQGGKRKSEDGGGSMPRAKRNRYISIAWYVIKARRAERDAEQVTRP